MFETSKHVPKTEKRCCVFKVNRFICANKTILNIYTNLETYLGFRRRRRRRRPHSQKHSVKAAAVRNSLADVKVNFIPFEEPDLTISFFLNR